MIVNLYLYVVIIIYTNYYYLYQLSEVIASQTNRKTKVVLVAP